MTEAKSRFSFPDEGAAAVVDALADDTNCLVLVIDVNGMIVWANQNAATACGVPREAIIDVPLLTFFPQSYVEERLGFIREAAAGQPLACEGLCWGLFRRTTFRPLNTPDGSPARVLIVCRPMPSDDTPQPAEHALPTRRSQYNDLGPLSVLTEKELEILDLIGRGLSTAKIAAHLGRSAKTIEWHRVALGEKLGAANRVGLARIAINAGLSAGPLPAPADPVDGKHPEPGSVEPKPTPHSRTR